MPDADGRPPRRATYDERVRRGRRSCAPAATRREALREAARIEVGPAALPRATAASGPSPTPSRTSTALRQLPGHRRAAADGRRLRLRRRGRLEDRGRSCASSKVMATGLPGGTSFMEDYTYHLDPARPTVLGAHMLEVCPSIAAGRPRCEIHPLSIGGKADPVRLVFDAAPGPAVVAGLLDLGDRFRLVANVIDVVAPPHEPAAPAGGPRRVAAAAGPAHRARGLAHRRRRRTTRCSPAPSASSRCTTSPRSRGSSCCVIDEATTVRGVREGAALEPGLLPPRRGAWRGDAPCDVELREASGGRTSRSCDAGLVTLYVRQRERLDRDAGRRWRSSRAAWPYDDLRPERHGRCVDARGRAGRSAATCGRRRTRRRTSRCTAASRRSAGRPHPLDRRRGWAQARRAIPPLRDDPRRPLPRRGAGHPRPAATRRSPASTRR